MRITHCLAGIVLTTLLALPVYGRPDPSLVSALTNIEPAANLDVTLDDGSRYLGRFAGVEQVQLLIQQVGNSGSSMESPTLIRLDLANIIRLQQQGSGAGKGFQTGMTAGAIIGGSLSLLWGVALDSLDGDHDETGAVLGFTMLGAAAGGLGLGAIGAGIGALAHDWQVLYEAPDAPAPPVGERATNTRVSLGLGMARGYAGDWDFQKSGLFGAVGLQTVLGSRFEVGPELAYYDLDGTVTEHGQGYTYIQATSPVVSMGLTGTWSSPRSGWAPYLILGTGLYIGGGENLGASLGGGIRYRSAKRHDFKLEIRDHLLLSGSDREFQLDYFLTIGASFSFQL